MQSYYRQKAFSDFARRILVSVGVSFFFIDILVTRLEESQEFQYLLSYHRKDTECGRTFESLMELVGFQVEKKYMGRFESNIS